MANPEISIELSQVQQQATGYISPFMLTTDNLVRLMTDREQCERDLQNLVYVLPDSGPARQIARMVEQAELTHRLSVLQALASLVDIESAFALEARK
jgi:hypothetical protein